MKKVFNFILVNVILLIIFALEERYIGSPGRARLEPYSPSTWEEIWNEFYLLVIISFSLTTFAFWYYYKNKKR